MEIKCQRRCLNERANKKRVTLFNKRMWRNWQTRRFQVPVGNRVGSNPFIRTSKSTNFDKNLSIFSYKYTKLFV